MTYRVSLRGGRHFDSQPDRTLLESALAQACMLEYSCRSGSCGVCRAKILDGSTVPIRPELSLSSEDREAGYGLTCCRAAISDVVLDVEELGRLSGFVARTLPARIAALEPLAPGVVRVLLRLPPTAGFSYLAGQFVDVIRGNVRRSYSLASAPRADGLLEMHIRAFDGGAMTAYWFGDAQPNDLIRIEGPLGTFHRRDRTAARLVFLATGTGIAPVKAILEELAVNGAAPSTTIDIYWGNRELVDFYWNGSTSPRARLTRVASRPQPGWTGAQGHVQDILLSESFDPENTLVYACGSQAMIEAARVRLARVGAPSDRFYFDAFVESGQ